MNKYCLGEIKLVQCRIFAIAIAVALFVDSGRCCCQPDETVEFFLNDTPRKWAEYPELSKDRFLQLEKKTWERAVGKEYPSQPTERLQIKRNKTGTFLLQTLDDQLVRSSLFALNEHYAFELSRKTISDSWAMTSVSIESREKKKRQAT